MERFDEGLGVGWGRGRECGWRDTWSPRLRRVPIRSCLHLLKMLLYCLLAFHAAAGNLMSNKFLFVCKCTCVYVCAYIECMYVRVCTTIRLSVVYHLPVYVFSITLIIITDLLSICHPSNFPLDSFGFLKLLLLSNFNVMSECEPFLSIPLGT